MNSFESLVKRRRSSTNRPPRDHNITVGGYQNLGKVASQKSVIKLADLVENSQRVGRVNSIQNLVDTCKNAQKKQVRFEEIALKPVAVNGRQAQLSLFTRMCNSRDEHEYSYSSEAAETQMKETKKTAQKPSIYLNRNSSLKQNNLESLQKITNEVNNDAEKFLRESITNLTQQEQKSVRNQVFVFKQKTYSKLKDETQGLTNIENLLVKVKAQINNEIDRLIDQTLCKRKNLYRLAQEEVKAYFSKLDSKKTSPGTHKTNQSTPCFDATHSNSRKNKGTQQRCIVRAFETASNGKSKGTPMSSARQQLDTLFTDTLKGKEQLQTNSKKVQSSNGSKNQCQSNRFNFTIGKDSKSTKTTKRIKDSIISGKHPSVVNSLPDHESVVVRQFNL